MYDTLEARLAGAFNRAQTKPLTKLQYAVNALRLTKENVSEAKRITANQGVRIAARTWHKAIQARILISPTPVL